MAVQQVAPLEFLVDGVVAFLSALSPGDFEALVLQARPPEPEPPAHSAPRPRVAA
jgi:hypothetical protein